MKRFYKCAAALLAVIMLLVPLAACGEDTPDDVEETETPEYVYVASYTDVPLSVSYLRNNFCVGSDRMYFVASYPGEEVTEQYIAYDNEGNPIVDENGNYVYEDYTYTQNVTGLFYVMLDGSDAGRMTGYTETEAPYGLDGYSNIASINVAADGTLRLFETLDYWYYVTAEGTVHDGNGNIIEGIEADPELVQQAQADGYDAYVDEYEYYMHTINADGSIASTLDLSSLGDGEDYFYLNSVTMDDEGNIFIVAGSGELYVLNSAGEELFMLNITESISENAWMNDMVKLLDGSVAVLINDYDRETYESEMVLYPVDLTTQGFGEGVSAPLEAYDLIEGNGDYDFYYGNGSSLYGFSVQTGTTENILTWINADVDNSDLYCTAPLADGRVVGLTLSSSGVATGSDLATDLLDTIAGETGDGTSTVQLLTLTPTPYSEVVQKETLTYACMYLNYNMRQQILNFNRNNPTYRIEVLDYSEYNTNEDSSGGITRMTTDILAGKVPDLIATDNLPIYQYSSKGILEDLWPYIEADEEIGGREGVVESVLNSLSRDGKLYTLYSSFDVLTLMGPTAVFGEEMGIGYDELAAAMAQYPDMVAPLADVTRDSLLETLCTLAISDYVDWNSGTCSFDQGFAEVLEFAAMFPENTQDSEDYVYVEPIVRIMDGEALLMPQYLYDFNSSRGYDQLVDGGLTFVGFPGVSGSGAAFEVSNGIAMSATCSNKEGAWEFMRTLIDDTNEGYSYGLPINKELFNEAITEAMTPTYYTDYDENGNEVQREEAKNWIYYGADEHLEVYAATQEEIDEIVALIDATEVCLSTADEQITSIILEEASAFFNGQRSAEDAAAMIQNRVMIYVSEQS